MILVPQSKVVYSPDGEVKEVVFFGLINVNYVLRTGYMKKGNRFIINSLGGPKGLYDFSDYVLARSVSKCVKEIFKLRNKRGVENSRKEGKLVEFVDETVETA